jgi:hypothetical protein
MRRRSRRRWRRRGSRRPWPAPRCVAHLANRRGSAQTDTLTKLGVLLSSSECRVSKLVDRDARPADIQVASATTDGGRAAAAEGLAAAARQVCAAGRGRVSL